MSFIDWKTIVNYRTLDVLKNLSGKELIQGLEETAKIARALNLVSIFAAGSGHTGGTLSSMDQSVALYFQAMKHDPKNPSWELRDRLIRGDGHKAPQTYTMLAMGGYDIFPGYDSIDSLMTLRKLDSPLQGHPDWNKIPALETSYGSLGQGTSIAAGVAKSLKLKKLTALVNSMTGDGGLQEGQEWEAAMFAAHHQLDNLTLLVDYNELEIDGWIPELMGIAHLDEKYRSFGWHAFNIDGHSMGQIITALDQNKEIKDYAKMERFGEEKEYGTGKIVPTWIPGKPRVIICHDIKGKGISFMENKKEWHGAAIPEKEMLLDALYGENNLSLTEEQFPRSELERLLEVSKDYQKSTERKGRERKKDVENTTLANIPTFPDNKNQPNKYFWNPGKKYFLFGEGQLMKIGMEPTRFGFGRALEKGGEDPRVTIITEDISDSIKISDFYKNHPERMERVITAQIAEANAKNVAAGLAKEGFLPVEGNYGTFAVNRALDQQRTTVCYGNFNVLSGIGHAGVSVGPDGATHQALEDIATLLAIPNMIYVVPCDSYETEKATTALLFDVVGPKAVRFAREKTPLVTKKGTPFVFGEANIYHYKGKEEENFLDAFQIKLASEYNRTGEDLTLIACGPMVPEALRAAYILNKEYNLDTRIINIHSVKVPYEMRDDHKLPFSRKDEEAILKAAHETNAIITIEEHQVGGFGNPIAAVIAKSLYHPKFESIGVNDRFGESGDPWELTYQFGLAAEHIAKEAEKLLGVNR
jgi:transketolase